MLVALWITPGVWFQLFSFLIGQWCWLSGGVCVGGGLVMSGRSVELFVPPEMVARPSVVALPVPVLPQPAMWSGRRCWVGMAAVDHSGRLRDQALLAVLGWQPGDRLVIGAYAQMAVLSRDVAGPFVIDSRGQVFLPASIRTLFRVGTGDRVVLVAVPEFGVLMVHPVAVVAQLLMDYYSSHTGDADIG